MSKDDQHERKEAYLDALQKTPVDRGILKRIHQVSDNTLDKWLYVPDRYPTFKACWELWQFQKKCQRMVSRKLHVLINRHMTRVTEVFQTTEFYKERLERASSEKYQDIVEKSFQRAVNAYMLNGKAVTISEAAQILGYKSYHSMMQRINKSGIAPGGDISHLISRALSRARKKSEIN